jgi:hypothetical protein
MNERIEDKLVKKRNMLYYNQLVMNDHRSKISKKKKVKKSTSFGSQKVEFKDFLYIPEEWEFAAYTFYFVGVPYIVGAIFLFLFVANGSYENFKLLNTNAFLIIWMIGYEIVAIFSLLWILILYLQYEPEEEYY